MFLILSESNKALSVFSAVFNVLGNAYLLTTLIKVLSTKAINIIILELETCCKIYT